MTSVRFGIPRRTLISTALVAVFGSARGQEATRIELQTEGVRTFRQLLRAMKEAAGARAPAQIKLSEVYRAFAEVFLDHAQDAIDMGMDLPADIKERISKFRKTAFPILVLIPLWGLTFAVPLSVFINAALTSAGVLLVIRQVLNERAQRRHRSA